jgi:glycosyltransferase involved in cell wall biosynthesis
MRVAFASLETTRNRGTAGSRRFERVARLLAGRGHDVTLFCGQWWDDYADEFVADGLRYRGVTLGTARSSYLARLPLVLARYRPDIVHVRPSPPEQVLAALSGGTLARAPVVVEWFGDEGLTGERRLTELVAERPSRVITASELVRTEVRELGAETDQTAVIPESIDCSRIETVDPADGVDIVYAHPLDETANIDDFLLGLAELRERDWQATVVGDGPRREAFVEETEALRIDDRVTFAGDCDRDERLALYRGAHAFVQTAAREQFATELLWALACGCVGIVEYQTDASAHELIESYPRSYRVTSPQQLADAIVDAGSFDHRTREETWTAFDHEQVIDQYVEEYRTLRDS